MEDSELMQYLNKMLGTGAKIDPTSLDFNDPRNFASVSPTTPSTPSDFLNDPALDPKVKTKMVSLARAHQKGGRAALEKRYDEMYPEKKP
jgi:hypothetical protein